MPDAPETPVPDQPAWEVDAESGLPAEPTPAVPESPPTPPPLPRILEALLFLGGPPLTPQRLGESIRGLTPAQIQQAVDALNQDYRRQGRPYFIAAMEQGYLLTLRPRYRPVVEKLYGSVREARLSPQAIDVLALVAYRQPAAKPEIDNLRGGESGALLRQLVRHGLVAIVERTEGGRRENCYVTTSRFLDLFGLKNLDDLPRTQDLQQL